MADSKRSLGRALSALATSCAVQFDYSKLLQRSHLLSTEATSHRSQAEEKSDELLKLSEQKQQSTETK